MRNKKVARFEKIKKFISIFDKHLRIADKIFLIKFRQKRATSQVVRRDYVAGGNSEK
jgi:hypothetical protein